VFDNPALTRVNPEYYAWLLSLPLLERERLLAGNWKIRPTAGLYFKKEWCVVVDEGTIALAYCCAVGGGGGFCVRMPLIRVVARFV